MLGPFACGFEQREPSAGYCGYRCPVRFICSRYYTAMSIALEAVEKQGVDVEVNGLLADLSRGESAGQRLLL